MANVKKITVDFSQTGATLYAIIRREADSFRLNDVNGSFAVAPADPYISLAEDAVIKGRYELSESRTVWNDGKYTAAVYRQAGGSPAPVSDMIISSWDCYIISDVQYELPSDIINTKIPTALTFTGSDVKATLDGEKVALSDATEGQIDDIQDALYNGKWVINPTAKTLTIYKADGITVLKIIDLTSTSAIIPTFIQGVPQ